MYVDLPAFFYSFKLPPQAVAYLRYQAERAQQQTN